MMWAAYMTASIDDSEITQNSQKQLIVPMFCVMTSASRLLKRSYAVFEGR